MRLVDNTELIVPRERERLMRFQQAELAGHPDTTFSGNSEFTSAPLTTSIDPALSQTALDAEVEEGLPEEVRVDDPTLHSHDTVGAVALDSEGRLAAGTSTGGTLSKAPGRVGDSSLIGCGCYADNDSAAVSLTGWGEPIMKLVLGKWAVDRVAAGFSPQQAATDAIDHLFNRLGGHGGIILLGPDGSLGIAHNTPRMAWGIASSAGQELGIARNS
jgi:beta-aspartyl-peptidase (threonine type)